ncbi:MAG: ATP-binding cassette domain-containing protein, partial [Bacteroidota bacterium]
NLNLDIAHGCKFRVNGHNGSGKSTLVQLLTGQSSPTEGLIELRDKKSHTIPVEEWPFLSAIASPSLDLPEDFYLDELFSLFFRFKPATPGLDADRFAALTELNSHRNKAIRSFSSGMKQRVKLGLAILCSTPILILDEPLSHLDQQGIEWYRNLCNEFLHEKTVIVCSNHFPEESFFCSQGIELQTS